MLVLASLTVALFAAARYVPVLGIIVSLLAPTPILLATLRYGLRTGLLALGLSILFLALLLGSFQSIIFLAEYGVMALVMAQVIRRQWSVEKTILASTVLPSVATGAVLSLLMSSIDLNLGTVKQHFEEGLSQAFHQLMSEGGGPSEEALRTHVQEAFRTVVQLLPALFVLSTAAGALLNYGVVRILWRRLGGQPSLPEMKLAQWKAPEVCIWVLIASGIGSFVPLPGMQIVGFNMLLLVSLIYLVQGLGIMVFYLHRAAVPPILRSLAYIMLVFQPLLLLGVAAFGLFDLWFDFRGIGNKQEETL
ncbi:MAG: YybS family protein [Candidatus Tectomicrobia bacterium]|nr:YybS family protein [Candidatus Tectomicrobia bacterium]